MRQAQIIIAVILIAILLSVGGSAAAHASLIRSEPPANSVLDSAPAEIRLYFSEPLESGFSSIRLRDINGDVLDTPPAEFPPDDRYQMVLRPGELQDGVYTIAWRALSAADGHVTQGSIPLIIGAGFAGDFEAVAPDESVPVRDAIIRWLNLISLALATGSSAFVLFVWRQAAPDGEPAVDRRLRWLVWAGWLSVGLTTLLLLWMQIAIITEVSIFRAMIDFETITGLAGTRFGEIGIWRVIGWLGLGAALLLAQRTVTAYWPALIACGGMMLTQSLFSHASAVQDAAPAVLADWLHLAASSLWIGGLIAFAAAIGPMWRVLAAPAPLVGRMVGYFSNYARATVAALALTGVYAGWLQVGSIEGLLTTTYGQTLIVKTGLMLPLLALAAVNLVLTHQQLMAGRAVWVGRLRRLISAEIALTVAVLGAVGVMTSISPARDIQAARDAIPDAPRALPLYEAWERGNLHIDLEITPGQMGENTFTIYMYDHEGTPIEDATLIRLRFDHRTENLGTSELRPEHIGDGQYRISGANLSVAGEWRIRTTVQRPGEFDTVIDYQPVINAFTPPPAPSVVDNSIPVDQRIMALLLLGMACIAAGGIFAGETRLRLRWGSSLLALLLLICGGVFLVSGLMTLPGADSSPVSAAEELGLPPDAPVRLVTASGQNRPLVLTADGGLLRPVPGGAWSRLTPPAPARDVYMDSRGLIWAVTDDGLYGYDGESWQPLDSMPAGRLVTSHGYLYTLSAEGSIRYPQGRMEAEGRPLSLPLPDAPARDLVMLGNHTHVLLNGADVFQTSDLGLSWEALESPAPVSLTAIDPDGNLLALTDDGLLRWSPADRAWRATHPLPPDEPVFSLATLDDRVYVAAGGSLYTPSGGDWQPLTLPAEDAYIITLTEQYPERLWALDAAGARLFVTTDGRQWETFPLVIG